MVFFKEVHQNTRICGKKIFLFQKKEKLSKSRYENLAADMLKCKPNKKAEKRRDGIP